VRAFAKCDHCGAQFTIRIPFDVSNRTGTVHIQDSRTPCKACDKSARLVDADYDLVGGVLAAFRDLSSDSLADLKRIAEQAAAGNITPQQAITSANVIHPGLGKAFEVSLKFGLPSLIVALLSLYIAWAAMRSSDRSSDQIVSELQAIHSTMEQQVQIEVDKANAAKATDQSMRSGNRHERRALDAQKGRGRTKRR